MKELIGKTIRIVEMKDEPKYNNKTGVVDRVDDMGQLHGSWGGLAVNPNDDSFEVLP